MTESLRSRIGKITPMSPRSPFLLAAVLVACAVPRHHTGPMELQFLTRDGCGGSDELRAHLDEVLQLDLLLIVSTAYQVPEQLDARLDPKPEQRERGRWHACCGLCGPCSLEKAPRAPLSRFAVSFAVSFGYVEL